MGWKAMLTVVRDASVSDWIGQPAVNLRQRDAADRKTRRGLFRRRWRRPVGG
jgi:hypothetical protein